MPNLSMRLPGTQFSADGLDIAWPLGGQREVVAVPDDRVSLRIKRRIAEGNIAIVDDTPTREIDTQAREYRLLTGEEARAHMAEPAGPVTRVVYHPADSTKDRERQLEVQSVEATSEHFREAQAADVAAAEEAHAALSKRQIEAEKAAARAIKATDRAVAEDPLAARLTQTGQASAEWLAARETEFMVRETARQKLEKGGLQGHEERAKILASPTAASVSEKPTSLKAEPTNDVDGSGPSEDISVAPVGSLSSPSTPMLDREPTVVEKAPVSKPVVWKKPVPSGKSSGKSTAK